jgi:hypothetical protein
MRVLCACRNGHYTAMTANPTFAFYGHHKCATMTLNTIINGICRRLGVRFTAVFDEFAFEKDLPGYVQRHKVEFLCYGNADIDYVKPLSEHKAFHIIRDPRDIVVSAYFSHLHSHSMDEWEDLIPHREKLKSMTKDEGIAEEIRFRGRSFDQMSRWDYSQENVLEVRFEDLVSSNMNFLLQVFDHIGIIDNCNYRFPQKIGGLFRELSAFVEARTGLRAGRLLGSDKLPAPELLVLAWRNRFEAKSRGRQHGEEQVTNHYRKGQPGDWKNHFTEEHKALFKNLYPGFVPQLGYAEADNW